MRRTQRRASNRNYRWYYNRKQRGTDELLSLMGMEPGQLDVLEGSVRFAGKSAAAKALPGLYDLFGLAKRIQPKFLMALGPSDLLKDGNLAQLNSQVNLLRFISSKGNRAGRAYYAAFRVLNASDFGAAVSKSYTVIVGVRADIANAHQLSSDRAILSLFPRPADYPKATLRDVLSDLVLPRGEEELWERMTIQDAKLRKALKFLPRDPESVQWLPSYGAKQLASLGYEKNGASKVYRTAFGEAVPDIDFYQPTNTDKWGLLHPNKNRVLTATEIAAAVGLPRNYKLKGNDYERAAAAAASIPPALTSGLATSLRALLSPHTKSKARVATLSEDAEKIHLAETLRAAAPKIRAYNCDVDLGDGYARKLQGHTPNAAHCDYLFDADEIGEDFVVYGPLDPLTGQRPVIGGIQRAIFLKADHQRMVSAINQIRSKTEYRGTCSPEPVRQEILDRYRAAGRKLEVSEDGRQFRLWVEPKGSKEGHWDRWRTNPIPSATEGWSSDKNTGKPQLSRTFASNPELKAEFDYLNQRAERAYVKIAPTEFRSRQRFLRSRVSSEYRLGNTVFTTLAINKYGDEMPAMNFHIDSGDKNSGLTCISVFNKGHYAGGYFVLPQYRCAFKVGDGDVFVSNSRKVHGVTQIAGSGQRLSVVSYVNTDLGYEEHVEKAYPPRSPRPSFRVDRYQIAIPSYRRSDTLKAKTLELLAQHKLDPKRVTIFVADEKEYKIYKKALEGSPYDHIVIAAPGLVGARNFIRFHYKEGTPVVFMDDDLKRIDTLPFGEANKLEPVRNLERDVIYRGFHAMREHQAYLWGIYAAKNPFYMKDKIQVGLYFIVGSFYGTIIRRSDDLVIGTSDKEDYERSVQHFIKDGRVVRLDFITADTNYYGEKGGLQETRTQATVEAGAHYMLKKYPKFCRDMGKREKGAKKGMHEIELRESE